MTRVTNELPCVSYDDERRSAKYYARWLRGKSPDLHDALKITLMREILRMTPEARRELDKRHSEALTNVMTEADFPKDLTRRATMVFRIAVHVRRGDKVALGEARPVPASTFVQGIRTILDTLNPPRHHPRLVHLFSDDANASSEFHQALASNPDLNASLKVDFRYAGYRPDLGNDLNLVYEAFWQLLVDLRMMVESDVYLGSQSSNVGVMACYLRVHHQCFNVENQNLTWKPSRNKIARLR